MKLFRCTLENASFWISLDIYADSAERASTLAQRYADETNAASTSEEKGMAAQIAESEDDIPSDSDLTYSPGPVEVERDYDGAEEVYAGPERVEMRDSGGNA